MRSAAAVAHGVAVPLTLGLQSTDQCDQQRSTSAVRVSEGWVSDRFTSATRTCARTYMRTPARADTHTHACESDRLKRVPGLRTWIVDNVDHKGQRCTDIFTHHTTETPRMPNDEAGAALTTGRNVGVVTPCPLEVTACDTCRHCLGPCRRPRCTSAGAGCAGLCRSWESQCRFSVLPVASAVQPCMPQCTQRGGED